MRQFKVGDRVRIQRPELMSIEEEQPAREGKIYEVYEVSISGNVRIAVTDGWYASKSPTGYGWNISKRNAILARQKTKVGGELVG